MPLSRGRAIARAAAATTGILLLMRLRVLFFSLLQDRFGAEERLEQFPGQTVADLLRYYRVVAPELGGIWDSIAVAVNQQYANGTHALGDGDEVALLPPVSGGSGMRVAHAR